MNDIEQKAEKEVEEFWDKNLKNIFETQLNNSIENIICTTKNEFKDIKNLVEKNIKQNQDKLNNTPNKIQNPNLIILKSNPNENILINSILMCLCTIPNIIPYLNNNIQVFSGTPYAHMLSPSILELINLFWKDGVNFFNPSKIHVILQNLINPYYDYTSENAGFLFHFILNQLNSEETNIKPSNHSMSDIFYNFISTRLECTFCHQIFFLYDKVPVITIYLNGENPNKCINITDWNSFLSKYSVNYSNDQCKYCNNKQLLYYQKIDGTSEVIIINIDRQNNPKNNIHFLVPTKFEAGDLIGNNSKIKYELISAISKRNNGFLTYIKLPPDIWYCYDGTSINKVYDQNDQKFDSVSECLLVYSKID